MSNFKFAVLISGNGSNLESIIEHINEKKIEGNICCVLSNNPKAFGIERAKEAGIPFEIINHKHYKERNDFDASMVEKLKAYKPDLIVLAGFMRILSSTFIKEYRGKILNIHPSLLPKYKGLNTHKRVLNNKDAFSGCTVHFVNSKLDSGKIILQKKVKISKKETEISLSKKILTQEHKLYPKAILKVFNL